MKNICSLFLRDINRFKFRTMAVTYNVTICTGIDEQCPGNGGRGRDSRLKEVQCSRRFFLFYTAGLESGHYECMTICIDQRVFLKLKYQVLFIDVQYKSSCNYHSLKREKRVLIFRTFFFLFATLEWNLYRLRLYFVAAKPITVCDPATYIAARFLGRRVFNDHSMYRYAFHTVDVIIRKVFSGLRLLFITANIQHFKHVFLYFSYITSRSRCRITCLPSRPDEGGGQQGPGLKEGGPRCSAKFTRSYF